ncbi:hypothetical protein C482_06904 [Natrialba chahannaoensis JCM 10990]|uniref:Uncharacterized protein n=1 Tax=Natrialba chahannaoensis JCM 10990 TaxID=1227492 RepID=M0AU76_9EURY|nr:hypothetical protein C482_06904 [Natrialba chahannaoensis JCM 10990]
MFHARCSWPTAKKLLLSRIGTELEPDSFLVGTAGFTPCYLDTADFGRVLDVCSGTGSAVDDGVVGSDLDDSDLGDRLRQEVESRSV